MRTNNLSEKHMKKKLTENLSNSQSLKYHQV